jgi:CHASE2 domain-containing sensor protein
LTGMHQRPLIEYTRNPWVAIVAMVCLSVFGSVAMLCGHNGILAVGISAAIAGLGGVALRDLLDWIRHRK